MNLTFKEAVEVAVKKIQLSEEECGELRNDMQIISNKIQETLEETEPIFKDMFKELPNVAHFTKGNIRYSPLDYDPFPQFKLPFKVDALFNTDSRKMLLLKTPVQHPIVENGFVNGSTFLSLLKENLKMVIAKLETILCSNGKTYKLFLVVNNGPVVKISAKEQVEIGISSEIIFCFLAVLKFSLDEMPLPRTIDIPTFENKNVKFWVAVSVKNNIWGQAFNLFELYTLEMKQKMKDINALLSCALNKMGMDDFIFTPFCLKYFDDMKHLTSNDSSVSSLLVTWLEEVVRYIVEQSILLEIEDELDGFINKIIKLQGDLKFYQLIDSVNLDEFLELFGLNN